MDFANLLGIVAIIVLFAIVGFMANRHTKRRSLQGKVRNSATAEIATSIDPNGNPDQGHPTLDDDYTWSLRAQSEGFVHQEEQESHPGEFSAPLEKFIPRNNRAPTRRSSESSETANFNANLSSDASTATQSTAVWLRSDQTISVHGFELDSGWIYVGNELPVPPGGTDDCLIDPALSVGAVGAGGSILHNDDDVSYARLDPDARAVYLNWLSEGRSDSNVDPYLGILFLAGVERRLIADSAEISLDERDALVDEIFRLTDLFSSHEKFVTKALNLAALESSKYRQYPQLSNKLQLSDPSTIELSRLILAKTNRGVYIDPPVDVLYHHLKSSGQYVVSNPERFSRHYQEQYSGGIFVGAQEKPFKYRYTTINPSLRNFVSPEFSDCVDLRIPEFEEEKLRKLLELSGEQDADFNTTSAGGIDIVLDEIPPQVAHAEIPSDSENADAEEIKNTRIKTYIEHSFTSGRARVPLGEILNLAEFEHFNFNRRRASHLCTEVNLLGYEVIPNPNIHGIRPRTTHSVRLLRLSDYDSEALSSDFYAAVVLVHLASMVSQADEVVHSSEKELIRKILDSKHNLSRYEKDSLDALFEWCFENQVSYKGIKRNIKKLGSENREAAWDHFVNVAVADNVIDQREIIVLDKIYDLLELDAVQKRSRIEAVANRLIVDDPIVQTDQPLNTDSRKPESVIDVEPDLQRSTTELDSENAETPSNRIDDVSVFPNTQDRTPERTKDIQSAPRRIAAGLDSTKLDALRTRNNAVRDLFGDIFDESDETEQDEIEDDDESPENDEDSTEIDSENATPQLDKQCKKLLRKLLDQDQWTRLEFEKICEKFDLFPDSAIEYINDWSFEMVDAPIIEDDEDIYIDRSLKLEV